MQDQALAVRKLPNAQYICTCKSKYSIKVHEIHRLLTCTMVPWSTRVRWPYM